MKLCLKSKNVLFWLFFKSMLLVKVIKAIIPTQDTLIDRDISNIIIVFIAFRRRIKVFNVLLFYFISSNQFSMFMKNADHLGDLQDH